MAGLSHSADCREYRGHTTVGSMRAGDIVRDAEHLQLYKRAGFRASCWAWRIRSRNARADPQRQHHGGRSTGDPVAAPPWHSLHGHMGGRDSAWKPTQTCGAAFARSWPMTQTRMPDALCYPAALDTVVRQRGGARHHQADRKRWDYKHQVLENPHIRPGACCCG